MCTDRDLRGRAKAGDICPTVTQGKKVTSEGVGRREGQGLSLEVLTPMFESKECPVDGRRAQCDYVP